MQRITHRCDPAAESMLEEGEGLEQSMLKPTTNRKAANPRSRDEKRCAQVKSRRSPQWRRGDGAGKEKGQGKER